MLEPNTRLQNRYTILRPIGQGGMGAVYEAVDERLRATVALKETFASNDEQRRGFEREAHLLANLRHPALPKVFDHFSEGAGHYLVMEYIPGEDLERRLEKRALPFAPDEVLAWADRILAALEHLHTRQQPVLHRDIKPANIKITDDGDLYLLDFGLAKGRAGQMTAGQPSRSLYGYSASYAPPEQIQDAGTDARSDIYSVAATLYHLLTKVAPPEAFARTFQVSLGKPDPLTPAEQVYPSVPHELSEILRRAMSLDIELRPQSAAELRAALHHLCGVQAPETAPGNRTHEQTKPPLQRPLSTVIKTDQRRQSQQAPPPAETVVLHSTQQDAPAISQQQAPPAPTQVAQHVTGGVRTVLLASPQVMTENVKPKSKLRMWLVLGLFVFGALVAVILYNSSLMERAAKKTHKRFKDNSGLFNFEQDDKYGFIDKTGKVIIPPRFDLTLGFTEGLAAVAVWQSGSGSSANANTPSPSSGYKWGYIDTSGKYVINEQFDDAWRFSEGVAAIKMGGKWGFIDKKGTYLIQPQFEDARKYAEGLLPFAFGNKWGYADKAGKYVVNPVFDEAHPFHGGLALVKQGDSYGYVDKTGKLIINPQYEEASYFNDGVAVFKQKDKWGMVDETGKVIVSAQFDEMNDFNEGLAAAKIGLMWGFIDKMGKVVINPQFDRAGVFINGLAPVISEGRMAYIDKSGKMIYRVAATPTPTPTPSRRPSSYGDPYGGTAYPPPSATYPPPSATPNR